ncbi:hypothetical protein CYMTET_48546 [Cymbomonas tetramitiformis]|uniref:cGMP-dependent protein kinase n=1 Tax=Cymbomonas tetramitiformis TaxID=36881 RepID=A0AAE0EUW4_9CHLO|nr:hypothetical protein CYMTET_48546 [Cymbomonas tetramitiformis]
MEYYGKAPKPNEEAKGAVDIDSSFVLQEGKPGQLTFTFEAHQSNKDRERDFELQADDTDSKTIWISSIREALKTVMKPVASPGRNSVKGVLKSGTGAKSSRRISFHPGTKEGEQVEGGDEDENMGSRSSSVASQEETSKGGRHSSKAAPRRGGVSSENSDEIIQEREAGKSVFKSAEALELLREELETIVAFKEAPRHIQVQVMDAMRSVKIEDGETVTKAGEQAKKFFIVGIGNFVNEEKSKSIRGSFGKESLLYDTTYKATIKANGAGTLWTISRQLFQHIMQEGHKARMMEMQNVLARSSFLSELSKGQRENLVAALEWKTFTDQEIIITEGEKGDKFFIIADGTVSVYKQTGAAKKTRGSDADGGFERSSSIGTISCLGQLVATLDAGDFFGEKALLEDEPRAASVVAKGAVECAVLERKHFDDLLGPLKEVMKNNVLFTSMRNCPILDALNNSERQILIDQMQEETFKDGDTIMTQGEVGEKFYIVVYGAVKVYVDNKETGAVSVGQFFGERALLDGSPRGGTVKANGSVRVAVMTRAIFNAHVGDLAIIQTKAKERVLSNRMAVLKKVKLFSTLTTEQMTEISDALVTTEFSKDEMIMEQGMKGDSFYIIESGEVVVTRRMEESNPADKPKQLARLDDDAFFGEAALMKEDGVRNSTVTAVRATKCLVINREMFMKMDFAQNQEIVDALMTRTTRQRAVSRATQEFLDSAAKGFSDLDFDGYETGKTLGCGTFGRVRCVTHRSSGKTFACKILKKSMIDRLGQREHTLNERDCLMEVKHPFVLDMIKSFQTERKLYIIMELIQGGELYNYCQKKGPLPLADVQFYAAQVVSGLQALHDKGYAYRDLKPENILIDKEGYLRIVDFGFAKIIEGQTFTFCGTPDYMAPEILTCRGHDKAADWWAVGVLIFEMLNGEPPFEDDTAIMKHGKVPMVFPEHFSSQASDLIGKLLSPNPRRRLGCLRAGVNEVKEHPFFKDIDWNNLLEKKVKAPYVPPVKASNDLSNFTDDYPDSDEEDNGPIDSGWEDMNF